MITFIDLELKEGEYFNKKDQLIM